MMKVDVRRTGSKKEEVKTAKDAKEGNRVRRNKYKRRRAAYNGASLKQ